MSSYRSNGRPRAFRKLNLEKLEERVTPTSGLGFGFAIGGGTVGSSYATATDSSGNAYITGYFADTAKFGAITLTAQSFDGDAYVAKFSPTGAVDWAVDVGGEGKQSDFRTTEGYGIAVDSAGNVYTVGWFVGTTDFGANHDLTSSANGTSANAYVLISSQATMTSSRATTRNSALRLPAPQSPLLSSPAAPPQRRSRLQHWPSQSRRRQMPLSGLIMLTRRFSELSSFWMSKLRSPWRRPHALESHPDELSFCHNRSAS
jgi:hypothetical protein